MRKAIEVWVGSMVVYVAMAACSGGSPQATSSKVRGVAGETAASASGAPAASGGEASRPESGAPGNAGGGLLDPVPVAGAQEGGAPAGCTCQAAELIYTKHVVLCDQLIKTNGTNYPAAILELTPASVVLAARVLVVSEELKLSPGWAAAGSGVMVKTDGSAIGGTCASATSSLTFYVPN